MKEWFESLAQRERIILIAGGLFLVSVLLWAMLWEPLSSSLSLLRTDVRNDRELLAWMQQASQTIRNNRAQGSSQIPNQHVSLINAIESTARQGGLRKSITSLDPQGDNKVNLRIENIIFNDLVLWQGRLEKEFSIQTEQLSITPTDKPGRVSARIQFTR